MQREAIHDAYPPLARHCDFYPGSTFKLPAPRNMSAARYTTRRTPSWSNADYFFNSLSLAKHCSRTWTDLARPPDTSAGGLFT